MGLGGLNYFGQEKLLKVVRASRLPVIVFLVHPWELIDAGSEYPSLPKGYAKACSEDLASLRGFLSSVKDEMEISRIAEVAGVAAK